MGRSSSSISLMWHAHSWDGITNCMKGKNGLRTQKNGIALSGLPFITSFSINDILLWQHNSKVTIQGRSHLTEYLGGWDVPSKSVLN